MMRLPWLEGSKKHVCGVVAFEGSNPPLSANTSPQLTCRLLIMIMTNAEHWQKAKEQYAQRLRVSWLQYSNYLDTPGSMEVALDEAAELMAQAIREECEQEVENLIDHLKIKQEKIDALCADLDEKDKEIERLKGIVNNTHPALILRTDGGSWPNTNHE